VLLLQPLRRVRRAPLMRVQRNHEHAGPPTAHRAPTHQHHQSNAHSEFSGHANFNTHNQGATAHIIATQALIASKAKHSTKNHTRAHPERHERRWFAIAAAARQHQNVNNPHAEFAQHTAEHFRRNRRPRFARGQHRAQLRRRQEQNVELWNSVGTSADRDQNLNSARVHVRGGWRPPAARRRLAEKSNENWTEQKSIRCNNK